MPSGPKKRKAARKKKETEGNDQSFEEESSIKLESSDENTTVPAVDDGLKLDSNKENSSLGLHTDHTISVVEEIGELVANDRVEVLKSNKQNLVHDANIVVIKELSDRVSDEHVEAGQGLTCVEDSLAVFQENFQNMQAGHILDQLEGLKKMVIEGLREADKTRKTLQKLLDGLTKIQQIGQ